jgi:bifunctional DNA-binding transcriptional regulator/antitoxin component of YhaV-PrlF toxin-antitoxin module
MADVTVDHKGRITLPPWAMRKLLAKLGTKLDIHSEGDRIVLERIAEIDPFAEAMKKPEANAIENMLNAQEKDRVEAEDRFEELIENPPEIKPEDNKDLWR